MVNNKSLAELRAAAIEEFENSRTTPIQFKVRDIVRISGGQQLIITEYKPSRPANPYLGVLVGGSGKQYKFGHKHRPTKIGEAPADHPALQALAGRQTGVSSEFKTVVGQLVAAVLSDNMAEARIYANLLQKMS